MRWARVGTLYCSFIFLAISSVYLLVPPPAPYVTLIKEGLSFAISSVAVFTLSKEESVFGGKTSKESENFSEKSELNFIKSSLAIRIIYILS